MQIPIDTAPLKALDVPTRWLLSTALDDAAAFAQFTLTHADPTRADRAELGRKVAVYRQISEAIRD